MTLACTLLAAAAILVFPLDWAVLVWTFFAALGGAVR